MPQLAALPRLSQAEAAAETKAIAERLKKIRENLLATKDPAVKQDLKNQYKEIVQKQVSDWTQIDAKGKVVEQRYAQMAKVGNKVEAVLSVKDFRNHMSEVRKHAKTIQSLTQRVYSNVKKDLEVTGPAGEKVKIDREFIKAIQKAHLEELAALSRKFTAGKKFRPKWFDTWSVEGALTCLEPASGTGAFDRPIAVQRPILEFFNEASSVLMNSNAMISVPNFTDALVRFLNNGYGTRLMISQLFYIYGYQQPAVHNEGSGYYKADALMQRYFGPVMSQLEALPPAIGKRGLAKAQFNSKAFSPNSFQSILARLTDKDATAKINLTKDQSNQLQDDAAVIRKYQGIVALAYGEAHQEEEKKRSSQQRKARAAAKSSR